MEPKYSNRFPTGFCGFHRAGGGILGEGQMEAVCLLKMKGLPLIRWFASGRGLCYSNEAVCMAVEPPGGPGRESARNQGPAPIDVGIEGSGKPVRWAG
jgi:hypothetical protein